MDEQTGEQDHAIEQVLESYLNLDKWQWRTPVSDEERQELAELTRKATEKAGAQGMQGIAVIRAWTEEDLGLYKIVKSVAHMATSKQCLKKILPYLRLLYDGLCNLPASYVCAGEKLHRGEKFIQKAFRHNLNPGDALKFKLDGCPGFSYTFTSFTTDPKEAASFKESLGMFYDEDDLISTDSEPSLSQRLTTFFQRYACEDCEEDIQMEQGSADIAAAFEDNVGELKTMLKNRFGKDLPPKKKQPKRTIIVVEDGVGYRLGNVSVVPHENEVLMEPGARLQVVVDNRTDAAQYGEGTVRFLLLKTETCLGLSVLTKKDGQDSTSPAKREERVVVKHREQREALKAFHREKRTGGCLGNLSPEIIRQLLQMMQEFAQWPSTSKGGLVTRSATRSAAGSGPKTARLVATETLRNAGGAGREMIKTQEAVQAVEELGSVEELSGLVLSEDKKAKTLIKQLWEESHDFDGACDWLLQVTVKQYDGTDDEEGKRIDASKVQTVKDYRCYSVDACQLLKVTVRNLSLVRTISFTPVYVDEAGNDDPEEPRTLIMLKSGESQELPIDLKKDREETEDGWDLRDAEGTKTLLRLRFAVAPPT